MSENKFYLNCPYSEKDLCKTLGAKWDKERKKWYVPEGVDRKKFKRWSHDQSEKKVNLTLVKK